MKLVDWIFEHPQIALFVGAAVFFWLKERLFGQKTEQAPPADEKWPGDDGEMVEWGEPTQKYHPTPPPLRSFPTPPPLVNDQEASAQEFQRQLELQARLQKLRASQQQQAAPAPPVPRGPVARPAFSSIRSRLRNQKELRTAIVMKEILGPPAGLR